MTVDHHRQGLGAGLPRLVTTPEAQSTVAYGSGGRPHWVAALGAGVDAVSVAYRYDGPLLLSSTWDSATGPSVVSFGYDAKLRRDLIGVNGVKLAKTSFDADGLAVSHVIYANQNAIAGTFETSRSLDPGAINTTRFLPAAGAMGAIVESTQTRNEYGEPANYDLRFGAQTLYSVTNVVRDLAGRVLSEREQVGEQTFDRGYGYDEAGRLEDVWLNGELAAHYAYDVHGNRLSRSSQGHSEDGVYDAGDRVGSYGGWNYDLDDNGRLRSRTDQATGDVVTYGYDSLGALRSVESEDGVRVDYGVDMQARRVRKSVNGVVVKRWLYQDTLRIVAELSPSGQVESRFVYGDRGNVPSMMVTASQAYRIVSDVRGSVRLVVNVDSGAIVQRLDYDEFGRVLVDTNPGFQPFGFAGGLYDPDTGLVRFGARDYDAFAGRWTARDPILFGGGQSNLYAYSGNDPVNFVDPNGLYIVQVAGALIGAGFNVYDAVQAGATSPGQIAAAAIVGAATGAFATLGGGVPSLIAGAFSSASNKILMNAITSKSSPCDGATDITKGWEAAAAFGAAGNAASNLIIAAKTLAPAVGRVSSLADAAGRVETLKVFEATRAIYNESWSVVSNAAGGIVSGSLQEL